MYTQSSDGSPRLVYKFEVEMKDNWYEAYVDVITGNIVRMVDWAADASDHFAHKIEARKAKAAKALDKGGKQKPLPTPKEPKYEYAVFPWGLNDPTTGKVKTVTKPWDNVASPLGWHSYITASNLMASGSLQGRHRRKCLPPSLRLDRWQQRPRSRTGRA
jgi:extracellular elastinolytic metalloproteinase